MNTKTKPSISFLGSYIKGRFKTSPKKSLIEKHISPADFDDLIFYWNQKPSLDLNSVALAGQQAHKNWRKKTLQHRIQKLKGLKPVIKRNINTWAQLISRETGKALWESKGEVKAMLSKIDQVLQEAVKRIETQDIPQAHGKICYKSRGLFLVIGPFNFPMHLPFGQILPALVAGNAVIFKGSQKTPATSQALTQAFDEISLEKGLYQMVQGGANLSQQLCSHKLIDAIFFTGSFQTGQKIKTALIKDYKKLLALEMGGYNSTVIWEDADLELAVKECLKSCFWTSGQRCSSTSQILLHKKIAKSFTKLFVQETQKLKVGHWREDPWMGSLIDRSAVKRFFDFQKEIKNQGGEILLEGQQLLKNRGYYVSPGIYKIKFNKNSVIGTQETFTPQVILYEIQNLKQALESIHHSGFGLSLSVFTNNKKLKQEIFYEAKVGVINYNLSSIGASGHLPFGGMGKSGNDRPAGAFAIDSCVVPVAQKSGI